MELKLKSQEFLEKFKQNHSSDEIISHIKSIEHLKILVIGDTIIDEYIYCTPLGKSAKENIVACKYINRESFAGGILACANHLSGFCNRVDLVTCLGSYNTKRDFIVSNLSQRIQPIFFYKEDSPTITKTRFVWEPFTIKLFEVIDINDTLLSPRVETQILKELEKVISEYDVVLVCDYGHGFITDNIINFLCSKARFLSVNTQANSANNGYNVITKYPKADYVCIDEPEIRLAHREKYGDLKVLMQKTYEQLKCKVLTVTRGHQGSTVLKNSEFYETPVLSTDVVDRIGAGDAFLAVTSPLVYKDVSPDMIGFVGNCVGALAVKIVGNKSFISPDSLTKIVQTYLN